MKFFPALILCLLWYGEPTNSYPTGAPSAACSSLTPNHGGSSQSSPSPYTIDLSVFNLYNDGNFYYEPGTSYQLTLSGGTFRGFLIQARLMSDDTTLVGSFSNVPSGTRLSDCTPSERAITHSNNNDRQSITGTWTAPPRGTGAIRFRFAVVQELTIYWADQSTHVVHESGLYLWFNNEVVANNSLLEQGDIGEGSSGISCATESPECCTNTSSSGWFSPDGSAVPEGPDGATSLYVTRGLGYVRLNRITGGTSGLYLCEVPDYSGTVDQLYVGLYGNSPTSGLISSAEVTFELQSDVTADPPEFILICHTQGGPASEVVWEIDGSVIMDNSNYTSSQIVVDTLTAAYNNTLLVSAREGGEYTCTVTNERGSEDSSLTVQVGTAPVGLLALQEDLTATSIIVSWHLPSPPITANSFQVFYETDEESGIVDVPNCTNCETVLSGLIRSAAYNISVITLSDHLPSSAAGPVTVNLATGCIELGYTSGCCVYDADEEEFCSLDLPGTNDCLCDETCYYNEDCCPDILSSCPPPNDVNLCRIFRGYGCDLSAQCVSVGEDPTDSASYQCVCNEGFIGDGNTTCIGASVLSEPERVLAINGSSGHTLTCLASSFPTNPYSWVLIGSNGSANTTVATGRVFQLPEVQFADGGSNYQCIVETQYGNISSNLVEVVVSPQGGVMVAPTSSSGERDRTVMLDCSTLGGPGNTFTWIHESNGQETSSDSSLTVQVASGMDGGTYTCLVENDAGNGMAETTIFVTPSFEVSPASDSVPLGGDFNLSCSADGYPVPTIEWVHFDTPLRNTDRTTIEEEMINTTITSTLTVMTASTSDFGQYNCRASTAINESLVVESGYALVSLSGTLSLDECDATYNLTEELGNLTVDNTRTVCFVCVYNGSAGPTTVWTYNNESVSDFIGTVVDGVLVIFSAAQVFSVDTTTEVQCMGTSTYRYSGLIRVLQAPTLPSEIVIEESTDISITCDSSGSIPVTSHTWRDSTNTTLSTSSVLTLPSITRNQAGEYTCTIEDDMGNAVSASTVVTVQHISSLLRFTPSPHFVLLGELLHLYCVFDGIPAPAVMWLLDGSAVNITDPDISVIANDTYSQITVENSTEPDSGTYSCNITNSVGNAQGFINVTVVEAPLPPIITIMDEGSNIAGQSYTLTCMATLTEGLPVTPEIQWLTANGNPIEQGEGITVGDLEVVEGVTASQSLVFSLLRTSHGGQYMCRANFTLPGSSAQDVASNVTFSVIVQIPPPSVSVMLPSQPIYEGTSQVLTCTAITDTSIDTEVMATFIWTQDGSSNFPESRVTISTSMSSQLTFQSNLTLNPVTLSDNGEYSCTAVVSGSSEFVEAGQGNTNTALSISAIPPPLVEISDSGGSRAGQTLTLTCTVTVVEGLVQSPYVEFVNASNGAVQHQTVQVGNSNTEGRITTLTLQFAPLITSLSGEYTCRATVDISQASIQDVSSESTIQVNVTISTPTVSVSPHTGREVPFAATVYSLACSIAVNYTYVDTGTEALVVWMNSAGQIIPEDGRVSTSPVQPMDSGYISIVTFTPLSLTDDGDYICRADINPDNSSSFVRASSPASNTYTLDAISPPLPNISVIAVGSRLAGEDLQLSCSSVYPQDIYGFPTVWILDQNDVSVPGITVTMSEGRVEGNITLVSLNTSNSGTYTCVSGYDIPEAGLDLATYFTEETTTVTVAIPTPLLTFMTVPTSTHIGTQTSLNCIIRLAPAVDSAVVVNSSWVRPAVSDGDRVEEVAAARISSNLYQASVLFNPLLSTDAGNYTCSVTVEAVSTLINGTSVESTYSLVTLDVTEPNITISPDGPTVVGMDAVLSCIVTVVENLVVAPTVEWVLYPGNATIAEDITASGSVYQRDIEFNPLQAFHGGLYICSASVSIPNTSIPLLSNNQSYTLVAQIPPPSVVITQDPLEFLVTGIPLSLTCTVTVPTSVDVDLNVVVVWTEEDMSDVRNSTDGRITVSGTVQTGPDQYEALLRFTPVSREMDNGHIYNCNGVATLQEDMEYVTDENGVGRASLSLNIRNSTEPVVSITAADTIPAPGQNYSINCTAEVMNGLLISPQVQWLAPNGMSIISGEDLSIVVEISGNVTLSSLFFTGITIEQAGIYTCVAVFAEVTSQMEYNVSVQTPPAMFEVTEVTQTSLSFSWAPPIITGPVIEYTLSCTTEVSGIDQPIPLQTAEHNATLNTLDPGVPYVCSVSARTQRETSLEAVITATTLEIAPSGVPLNFTAVPVGARNITFSWESPEPHLRNGIIIHYNLICEPRPPEIIGEAGMVTLSGFTPITSYNCSLSASNSAGEGPRTYDFVTTDDDTTLFQLRLLGVSNCHQWVNENADLKQSDLKMDTVENINQRCDCGFVQENIVDSGFQCFDSNLQAVTFRASLRGLPGVTSTELLTYTEDWVYSGATISVQSLRLEVDSICPVAISSFSDPECGQSSPQPSSSLDSGAVAGLTIAAVLVIVLALGIVIVLVFWYRRRYHAIRLKNLRQTMRKESSDAMLLGANRFSGSSISEPQTTEFPYVPNPHYASKGEMYEIPTPPELRRSLPPIPTEDEEDGYAVPSKALAAAKNRRPSEYLEPASPSKKPEIRFFPPTGMVFENRSSGIYDDPDYTPSPTLRHKPLPVVHTPTELHENSHAQEEETKELMEEGTTECQDVSGEKVTGEEEESEVPPRDASDDSEYLKVVG